MFEIRFCFEKNKRLPFLSFIPLKNEKTDIFHNLCLTIDCEKPLQFDHKESENRGSRLHGLSLRLQGP